MNWFTFLTRSKGAWHLFERMWAILNGYDLTSNRMARTLYQLHQLLDTHHCSGTFPITAVALERHPEVIRSLAQQGMEFAIHGYVHVDHSQLSPEVQYQHMNRAMAVFAKNEIPCYGFRSPYLHWNSGTLAALKSLGLLYENNQPVLWEVLDGQSINPRAWAAYQRVIDFYAVKSAAQYLSIPRLVDGLVRMPVAIPDDEMLVERLRFRDSRQIECAWRLILQHTYERGELFVLSLHPERTGVCYQALTNVLADARVRQPAVWITQLRDLASWWRHRQETQVYLRIVAEGRYHLNIQGPKELTVLIRGGKADVPIHPWFDGYFQTMAPQLTIQSPSYPCLGVSPQSPVNLVAFLREWGYLVEVNEQSVGYGLYFDQRTFNEADEKPLIDRIEGSGIPLIRLGLWPAGARSALAVTGDIDALTLWDFGLRIVGA